MNEKIGGCTVHSMQIKDAVIPESFDLAMVRASKLMLEALQNLENDARQIPDHAWKLCQEAVRAAGGESK